MKFKVKIMLRLAVVAMLLSSVATAVSDETKDGPGPVCPPRMPFCVATNLGPAPTAKDGPGPACVPDWPCGK